MAHQNRTRVGQTLGAGGIEMTMEMWQNFDNYGAGLVDEAPDAVDRTSELLGLLGS